MKTIQSGIIAAAFILGSVFESSAVVGQSLEIQGTNLVLSFPSTGSEYFLIQNRSSLDPSTPWGTLTNAYPANSTNRTTFVIPCCLLPASPGGTNGGGSSSGGDGPPAPGASMTTSGFDDSDDATELWAMQSSGVSVPLKLYPPGFDTNNFFIFEVEKPEKQSESKFSFDEKSFDGETPVPMDLTSGGCDCPNMAFFRVFLVPDFFYDYAQYHFSYGVEFLPIYLGVDAQAVPNAQILVNGQVFPYARYTQAQYDFGTPGNPNVQWTYGIWFYSDRLTNGTYQLQLRTTLQLDGALTDTTPFLTLTNPAVSIVVSNPIVFKTWNNLLVGTNHTFKAQTTIFPATWEIDVFDANGQWVSGQTGTTTNGNISWTWDLYDDFGNLRDNVEADPYFDPYVTLISAGGTVQRPAPLSALDYPYNGGWNVAYQDKDKFVPAARVKTIEAWQAVRGGPSLAGLASASILLKYGRTNDVDMSPDPLQAMKDRNASWDNLKGHLLQPLFRNFYYWGHGSAFVIGGDWDKMTNEPPYGIHPDGAEYDLNVYQDGTNTVRTEAFLFSGWCYQFSTLFGDEPHPYRFVFLDGCSTVAGDWPAAFGIGAQTNDLAYYTNQDRFAYTRPSAFVGWNVDTYYSYPLNTIYTDNEGNQWGDYRKYAFFRSEWMFWWRQQANSLSIVGALTRAYQNSGWISQATFENTIRVYGYRELRLNEFNQRGDWPPPPEP